MDVAQQALKDRICDKSDRIPTSRWPFYSTSLEAALPPDSPLSQLFLTFTAERDTLFTDLSIVVLDDNGDPIPATVVIEYCNTQYADRTDVAEWAYCCDRKPIFLVGVREDKKLRFQIDLVGGPFPDGAVFVVLTLSGFQGDGCCS